MTPACRAVLAVVLLTLTAACSADAPTRPEDAGSASHPIPAGSAATDVVVEVDIAAGTARVASAASAGLPTGPRLAVALDTSAVAVLLSNVQWVQAPGGSPGARRVTFDVRLRNRLPVGILVPPNSSGRPSGPTGDGLLAHPGPTTLPPEAPAGARVTANTEFDGEPFNFAAPAQGCAPLVEGCRRFERFDAPLAAGATSEARGVGFDADSGVTRFAFRLFVAADVSSPGSGAVTGRVINAVTGVPIAGAQVRVTPVNSTIGQDVLTGADGTYRSVVGLADGQYTVVATAAGYVANTAANLRVVALSNGAAVRADFALPPLSATQRFASLSGRVIAAGTGVPIVGAAVAISGGAQTNGEFQSTTTDAVGNYALAGIVLDASNGQPIAAFSLRASASGYATQSRPVALVQNQTIGNVDFALDTAIVGVNFFTADCESAAAFTLTGFWNVIQLAGTSIPNRAFPQYVRLAPDDSSGGRLPSPAPTGGASACWYGQPATGNFLGVQFPGDPPLSGGTSTAVNSGTLTTTAFTVPVSAPRATLQFDTWFEIESVNPNAGGYDILTVSVVDAATGTVTQLGRLNPFVDPTLPNRDAIPFTSGGFNRAPVWRPVVFDLSAYRGRAIRVQYRFQTIDELYNGFRGWFVDNIRVSGDAIAPALAARALRVAPPTLLLDAVRSRTPRTRGVY